MFQVKRSRAERPFQIFIAKKANERWSSMDQKGECTKVICMRCLCECCAVLAARRMKVISEASWLIFCAVRTIFFLTAQKAISSMCTQILCPPGNCYHIINLQRSRTVGGQSQSRDCGTLCI